MSANDELQAHTCEKMLEFYGKPQDYVKKSHNEQDLTEQWKKGELDALDKLIKQIETIDNNRALSDEYLKSNGQCTREDYNIVGEWGYGIVWVIVDYVLPYLKRVLELKEFADYSLHNRDELTRQINFWMDKHTQVEKENQQLKALLKEWMHFYPIILYEHEDTLKTKDIIELYEKTANAIGEKK